MISPWFFHEIPIKSISCISHQYSISPYLLTHIQPPFIPWNPQEIPRKSPWKYLWDTQNSDSGGQGLSQHRRKQMGRVAKSVRRLRLGKKGDLSMECMDHVLQMDWLWLVMIGFVWKKRLFHKFGTWTPHLSWRSQCGVPRSHGIFVARWSTKVEDSR